MTAEPANAGCAGAAGPEPALEAGRLLFARDCTFLGAAADEAQLPDFDLPEVAFAGRSNVGKSSLLNALTGRKSLARISHTPGRTRQLNFFDLGGRLVLVDLPGYGYARAAKTEIRRWTGLMRVYLRGRPLLRRVCLLVDARHGLKPSDREMMAELDAAAVSYQIVLTKADKVKPRALSAIRRATAGELAGHPAAHPECRVTSAATGDGMAALRAALAALAAPAP
ncbi:MAG: ribosome biogenesis GTP-binding protein YihA/YsxC [Kiloniellaceae bacterium]